jgi:short-subunit dehydrogenase
MSINETQKSAPPHAAVITGASSGIGREIAKILSEKNNFQIEKLYLLSRRGNLLEELKKELNIPVEVIVCDVSKNEDIAEFANYLEKENPDIKLLVNSAGFGKNGDFSEISLEENLGMIDTNCRGLVAITHTCLKYMTAGAKILNISSVAGFAPLARFAIYGASKAFVTSFSIGLAAELEKEKRNISVTICAPGSVDTNFHKIARGSTGIVKKLYSHKASVRDVSELALKDTGNRRLFSSFGFGAKIARTFGGFVPRMAFARFSYNNIYSTK